MIVIFTLYFLLWLREEYSLLHFNNLFFIFSKKWSSPYINHFLQPDSLIPDPVNPQAWNRYSYVGNRPVNFSDPTGHNAECGLGESGCRNGKYTPEDFKGSLDTVLAGFDIATNGGFNRTEKWSILRAARAVGEKFAEERGNGESATDAFTAVYDPITSVKTDKFEYTDKSGNKGTYTTGCKTEVNTITCADFTYWIPQTSVNNIVHELGHVFDPGSGLPQIFVDNRNFILHPDDATGVWNQNPSRSDFETFGDFFLAWTFDVWGPEADTIWPNYESVGSARDWMNTSMDGWLGH